MIKNGVKNSKMAGSYKTIISKMLKFCSCVRFTIMLSKKCAAHLGIFLWGTLGGCGVRETYLE